MYNLEVAQDHTFVVGVGQWIVHNCGTTGVPDPTNKVTGQKNLYNGEQIDVDVLRAKGWKLDRNDPKFAYQDALFEEFVKGRGENTMKWRYVMQTFKKGKAEIENHFWYNIDTREIFHHH